MLLFSTPYLRGNFCCFSQLHSIDSDIYTELWKKTQKRDDFGEICVNYVFVDQCAQIYIATELMSDIPIFSRKGKQY